MSREENAELEMAESLGGSQMRLDPTGGSFVAVSLISPTHNVNTINANRCVLVYRYIHVLYCYSYPDSQRTLKSIQGDSLDRLPTLIRAQSHTHTDNNTHIYTLWTIYRCQSAYNYVFGLREKTTVPTGNKPESSGEHVLHACSAGTGVESPTWRCEAK